MSSKILIILTISFALCTQPVHGQKKGRARRTEKPAAGPQIPGDNSSSPRPATGEKTTDPRVMRVMSRAEDYFKSGQSFLKRNEPKRARAEFDKAVDAILSSGMDVRADPRLQTYYLELVERIYRLEVPLQKASGFKDQKFEPSPQDELAQLTLTPSKTDVRQEGLAGPEWAGNTIDFKFNVAPLIQQLINYYQSRARSTMETGLRRSGLFMRMARRIFREEGVPEDIAWLGQVESNWNPKYLSASRAGLWQFPVVKAKEYGLSQSTWVDERMSLEKATRASAKYLKSLAGRYNGNWELAIAAFDVGEGDVDRAVSRAGRADFWAIYSYIPPENRNFVPSVMATILIAKNPEKYGFHNIRPDAPLSYDVVEVQSATNLHLIADAIGSSIDDIRNLNPELLKDTTPQREAYRVRIPAGQGQSLVAVLTLIPVAQRAVLQRVPEEVRASAVQRAAALKKSGPKMCELTLAQSPELRGFRLGMPLAQVKEKLVASTYYDRVATTSEFGERSFRISGYQLKGDNSKGVRDVEFGFLDDKLTSLKVTYDDSVRWTSSREFISRVVEALGLPSSSGEGERGEYRLECRGFFVEIVYGSGYGPGVRLYDPEAHGIVAKRRAEKEEKKRREFKP